MKKLAPVIDLGHYRKEREELKQAFKALHEILRSGPQALGPGNHPCIIAYCEDCKAPATWVRREAESETSDWECDGCGKLVEALNGR